MERAPGVPMSRRTAARNLITVYRLAEAFADAHVALHRLPVEGCPLPSEGFSVDRRLASHREWMGRSKELSEEFAWLEAHKAAVIPEEISICHNDFRPVNIIVGSSYQVSVIDWSNVDLGDRHEDVADVLVGMRTAPLRERTRPRRLFDRVSRGLFLWRYLRRYRQQLPVDPERLRYWEALRALVQWGVRSAFESAPSEWLAVQPNDAALQVVAKQRANLYRYFWQRARE
jgi:aminoglycoside phosphotransferase (APT) family kinase protein